jgi:hypothetical protein
MRTLHFCCIAFAGVSKEFRVKIVTLHLFALFHFVRDPMGVGPGGLANSCDLPGYLDAALLGLDGELVVGDLVILCFIFRHYPGFKYSVTPAKTDA